MPTCRYILFPILAVKHSDKDRMDTTGLRLAPTRQGVVYLAYLHGVPRRHYWGDLLCP